MDVTKNGAVDLSLMVDVFEKYRGQPGSLIPILQKAQAIYGYLPTEVLQLIAKKVGVSVGRVYGVATFYTQFYLDPRGRHILKLCDGTACHVKGTSKLLNVVEEEFHIQPGQTSDDGQLTVEIIYCMGSCALAPVAVLDNQVMARMQQDTLVSKVKKHIGVD